MGWLRDTFGRLGAADAPLVPAQSAAAPAVPWRKLGNDAIAAGDYAEAARCYEQGVAVELSDASLRLNLGFALLELAQFGPAEDRFRQALA